MKYIGKPVEVEAFIIISVGAVLSDGTMHLALQNGSNYRADKGMLARYIPEAGDYLVIQADGYKYVNPKDVFERKYAPSENEAGAA